MQFIFAKDRNEVNIGLFFPKEIRYYGSRTQKPSSWHKTLKLMEEGKVDPQKVVTMKVSLDDWETGFTRSKNAQEVKVVIQVSGEEG